jgi:acyl carrier protein
MDKQIFNEVMQVLIEEVNANANDLHPDTKLVNVGKWNSLGFMRVLTALEVKCGIQYEIEELVSLATVGDLCDFVSKKKGTIN